MLSNNHNSNCAFAEQIVAYIYHEATVAERNEFEKHLLNCLSCADEIAGFGLVRSSINEWRKEEFFALESPALEIPAIHPVVAVSEKISWIDELRKLFSFTPAWVGGFAALIICLGLVWLFFGTSTKEMTLDKSNDVPEVTPKASITELPKLDDAPVFSSTQDEKADKTPQQIKVNQPKTVTRKNQTFKAVKTPKLNSNHLNTNNSMANNKPKNSNNKPNQAHRQEAPTLSGIDKDEDNSLRLSALFDEIGTNN